MLVTRLAPVGDRPRAAARDALLREALADAGAPAPGTDDAFVLVRHCPTCGSDAHGKPEVAVSLAAGWHVSVSYAAGLVAVAVTDDGAVGIDVEDVAAVARADVRAVLLSVAERVARPVWSARDVARTWSRKEALLKATGHGLALAPSSITLSDSAAPGTLLTWPNDAAPPRSPRWQDLALPDAPSIGPDLVGTVVTLAR